VRPQFGLALVLLLLSEWATGQGQVALLDKPALRQTLAQNPPCCVVDARGEATRRAKPIKDALAYRSGLRINPTATVVVVADSDARALATARALNQAHPGKPVIAVKGGFAVWQAMLIDAEPKHGVQGSTSFVIPRNTCEQDAPLQQLMRAKP